MTSREDHAIEIRIEDLVSSSADIDPFAVHVESIDGIVHLRGLVGSFAERLAAMELAAGVVAAENIRNEIQVRPYGADWKVTDVQIETDIRHDLESVLTPPDAVDVEVDHHVVTLRGQLPSGAERAEIRHVVEAVRGVNIVHNEITV
jgi:osmotically-inducible protein OsmY